MTQRIVVIGAGTMGRGIAQIAAIQGLDTCLCDVDSDVLAAARKAIDASVQKGIARGKTPPEAADKVAASLRADTSLASAVEGADFVIEAVPEHLDLKKKIFGDVASHAPQGAILASNTSSLPVTELAASVPRPEQFIGMHFFNPVPIMALVEIVRGLATSDETADATRALTEALGKEPIVVQDSPGFATSRLGLVIGLEAIRMLEAGVASPEEIDKAMELGYRHPMGPLRLTDLVGLDVRLAIAEHLHREIGEQFRPPALLRKMVRAGRLGKKSGRGFYDWTD
ncbi:MAG: 3-hydroxyacyl-CoA dehydrogenase family protein [Planctomycetota bacterium]